MTLRSTRELAILSALAAGFALGLAEASEHWGGLVPCALCLLERWPYRVAIILSLGAAFVPRPYDRGLLMLVIVTMLVSAALAVVHVGVELQFWPSPLPECAAPRFTGGTIAERLSNMPSRPAKPCDAPTYLIPGLPISMAVMNLLYAVVFALVLDRFVGRSRVAKA